MALYTKYFEDVSSFNLENYKEFMLDDIIFNKIKLRKMDQNLENEKKMEEDKKDPLMNDVIFPNKDDQLFWCIYIGINGVLEYEQIKRSFYNKIISEKQKIGNFYSENFKKMNNIKIKITNKEIKEIIANIMLNKEMDIEMVYAFAIYYEILIRIINIDKEIYLDIEPNEYKNEIILIKKGKEYGIDLENSYKENLDCYVKLEKYNKPLKAISSYNVGELREIADKLTYSKIDSNSNKQELYKNISIYCSW